MGNCQAIDTATLVIQHPCGRVEKMYWSVSASEVMKMNPGHYVALLITSSLCHPHAIQNHHHLNSTIINNNNNNNNNAAVRITRVKLLRPTDSLVLGQVYRLITTQEVMKGMWAKKQAKLKKNQSETSTSGNRSSERVVKQRLGGSGRAESVDATRSDLQTTNQVTNHEQHRQRTTSTNSAMAKSKTWQPSLRSISEATS